MVEYFNGVGKACPYCKPEIFFGTDVDLGLHNKMFHDERQVVWKRSPKNPSVEFVGKSKVPLTVDLLKVNGRVEGPYDYWLFNDLVCRKRKV